MNQHTWTYRDKQGVHHTILLMHGAKTGHVMIAVNNKISHLDFDMLTDKTYSTIIHDNILMVSIKNTGIQSFSYSLSRKSIATSKKNESESLLKRLKDWLKK